MTESEAASNPVCDGFAPCRVLPRRDGRRLDAYRRVGLTDSYRLNTLSACTTMPETG